MYMYYITLSFCVFHEHKNKAPFELIQTKTLTMDIYEL